MKNLISKYDRLREEMVAYQVEKRGITDQNVLNAMRKVQRHLFVSEALMEQAYGDFPLPIGEKQTISQPRIVAEMTQALQLKKNYRVLEIGTGSGYQAVILAEIVYKVYTVERIHSLFLSSRSLFDKLKYHNIVTKYTDGTIGWKQECPFDAIMVTAGAPSVPDELINQLSIGGRMIIPVGNKMSQELILIHKEKYSVHEKFLGGCKFVNLIGEQGWND